MEILAFADDTSGAMDVAGSFSSRGFSATVHLTPGTGLSGEGIAHVIDLGTRYCDPYKSGEALGDALSSAGKRASLTFLKVDSTLRGNVMTDVEAISGVNYERPIFIAPAFPFYGRTCINGVYTVKDRPITDTEFARDSSFRHKSSWLHDDRTDIQHVYSDTLDSGVEGVLSTVSASIKNKFTFDTRDQTDLEIIADAATPLNAVMVGSAGLARAIPRRAPSLELPHIIDSSLPTLFVIGSMHRASRMQKRRLIKTDMVGIELSPTSIGDKSRIEDIRQQAQEGLERRDAVCLYTTDDVLIDVPRQKIEMSLAVCAQATIPHNLVIAGGETVRFSQRKITSLAVRSEYEPGVPIAAPMQQTICQSIITKAGGFGHPDTLVDIHNFLDRQGA